MIRKFEMYPRNKIERKLFRNSEKYLIELFFRLSYLKLKIIPENREKKESNVYNDPL